MKISLSKEQKEQLLGLLPFSNDATEEYISPIFKNFDKKITPIFVIRPFKPKEKQKYQTLILKIAKLVNKEEKLQEISGLNQEIFELVSNCILDIKNLVDLGTMEVKKPDMEDDHIKFEFFNELPEVLRTDIYKRVEMLSGLNQTEKASL